MTDSSNRIALYLHWPFCASKCPYCDFNSHVREAVEVDRWQQALLSELEWMARWVPDATLGSIFFGGGTPSLMPPSLAGALIDRATALFSCVSELEITLEANPSTAEANRFRDFHQAGVNRLSIGVQSFDDNQLLFLLRKHSSQESREALRLAAQYFDRYSFDLIYALPDQTCQAWEQELAIAADYAHDHLSLYQLTIEPNTAFHHLYHARKAFELPKDELAEDLFLLTQQTTESMGLPAYEISNHAAPGKESRHNLTYWRGEAYLGVGPGAHGRVRHADGRWVATQTLKSPERWLERALQYGHGLESEQEISPYERSCERLLTGLRLREGLAIDATLEAILDRERAAFYARRGLLIAQDHRLRATTEGWLVLNRLIAEIIKDTDES